MHPLLTDYYARTARALIQARRFVFPASWQVARWLVVATGLAAIARPTPHSVILKELAKSPALTDEQIDQYLQVAFDLQAIQQHEQALSAFMAIDSQNLSAKNRRELAYWKAESLQKLARYEQAALLYLESAPAPDGSYDPWYHTASFQAAEAMAEAGLLTDARRQYLALLNITGDPARQVVLRQRLQDLRLLNSAAKQNKETP